MEHRVDQQRRRGGHERRVARVLGVDSSVVLVRLGCRRRHHSIERHIGRDVACVFRRGICVGRSDSVCGAWRARIGRGAERAVAVVRQRICVESVERFVELGRATAEQVCSDRQSDLVD